jgi:glycosyltransferase involved in cell wall biosynthesis
MQKKIKLGFDGRVLSHHLITGVERYAIEILGQFNDRADVTIFKSKSKNRYFQHFWEQFIFPIKVLYGDIDMVFCPAMALPLLLPKKIPITVVIHDLSFLNYPKMYSWKFRTFYRLLMPLIIKRADLIITPTENERLNIIKFYPDASKKLVAIHEGVGVNFKYNNNQRLDIILAVGSTNIHKNLKALLEAFIQIYNKIQHKLVIVGGSRSIISNDSTLQGIVENIPPDRILFTGYVTDDDLIDWYNKADLFVFPSLFEGFGLPPLEAMSCGCPVLCSNRSCLPEVCGSAARYFDPENIAMLSQLMLETSLDLPKKVLMREEGLAHSSNYSWNSVADKTFSAMIGLLHKD